MLRRLACALIVLLAGSTLLAGRATPAEQGGCRPDAIERLRTASPDGFAIYLAIKDKAFLLGWIDCGDPQLGLPAAVHESVHHITADTDAFPLLGGGRVARPHEASSFFPPARIAGTFEPSDFVDTYLRPGGSSSARDFTYLLDELNAYTHDLATASRLGAQSTADEQTAHRDGLAALMAFVATYVEAAENGDPTTWRGLHRPAVKNAVSELWAQAETTMAASCRIENFGSEDRIFLRRACGAGPKASLGKILGRPPACPTACLKSPARTVMRGDTTRRSPRM